MTAFRIKLCGLNNVDISSLKSMLNLAKTHLTHPWEIVTSEQAELFIYSFDSDEGKEAWQQHDPLSISALLSTQDQSDEDVDIILKRPLRTKNFSATLNDIEEKITMANDTSKPKNSLPEKSESSSKMKNKTSFFSNLSSVVPGFLHKNAKKSQPKLHFSLPEQNASSSDTIVDPLALTQWLQSISTENASTQAEEILSNLIPLNRLKIPSHTRFTLLEHYCPPIKYLLTNHHGKNNSLKSNSHTDHIKTVHSLDLLANELVIAYKILLNEYHQQNKHADSDNYFLIAINRVAEYLSASILHAYYYYYSTPSDAIKDLHLLYLYCEYNDILVKEVPTSSPTSSISFIQTYKTTLLIGIANPYRLMSAEIIKLYQLAKDYVDSISISQLDDSNTISAGYFQIDTSQDKMPIALAEISTKKQTGHNARLFDTQAMLEAIEYIFQQNNTSTSIPVPDDLNTRLLKKIIPQFNASYSRRSKREPVKNSPNIEIVIGLKSIHTSLISNSPPSSIHCIIRNHGKGGMMISSEAIDCYYLAVGDIIGLFESSPSPQLAIVRWMETYKNGVTNLGLEFQADRAIAVEMNLEKESESFLGLVLPKARGVNSKKTILVEKGTYLPLQTINVTEDKKTYKISIDSLIDNDLNCEQFIFNLTAD